VIDPTVRPATDADAVDVAWLESLARATLADRRGGERWLATHPPHGGSPDADTSTWVATIDDVVVGYLVWRADGDVATILDVFVHPEARELGFGDELLAAAIGAARSAGAQLLEGEALPGDRETKNLYERAGITARLITVSTPL
jgi:GNAT superfamily N-acetyltransferase